MKKIYSPYFFDEESMLQNKEAADALDKKISELSEPIKEIVRGGDTPYFLEMVCMNASLSEDQSKELSHIVRGILLGEIFINDSVSVIKQRLNIDQPTAEIISDQIVNKLFAPAKEEIKEFQQQKFPDRLKQGSPPIKQTEPELQSLPSTAKNMPPVNQNNVINLREPQ